MNDLISTFRNLPPGVRRGAALVGAVVAVLLVLRSRNTATPSDTADAATVDPATGGAPVSFDTSAIDSGALGAWQDQTNEYLQGLAENQARLLEAFGSSRTPSEPAGTVHWTAVGPNGETPNQIAVRLRKAGAKTANGQAITAAYLIRFNTWKVSPTTRLFAGAPVRY